LGYNASLYETALLNIKCGGLRSSRDKLPVRNQPRTPFKNIFESEKQACQGSGAFPVAGLQSNAVHYYIYMEDRKALETVADLLLSVSASGSRRGQTVTNRVSRRYLSCFEPG